MNIIVSRKRTLPIPISFIELKKTSDCNKAIMMQKIATGTLRNFGIQSIGNNLFILTCIQHRPWLFHRIKVTTLTKVTFLKIKIFKR